MRGAGTKQVPTTNTSPQSPRPLCLDVTRTVRRTDRLQTGIDRVEWAYLDWLLAQKDAPVFGLLRTALGYILLDRRGLLDLHLSASEANWGALDLLSRLTRRVPAARKAAESTLRKKALARATPWRLPSMLRKSLPRGTLYLNVGHANLTPRVFQALAGLPDIHSAVMIHDVIPLTHPQYQREGQPEIFQRKLDVVCAQADHVICNSHDTQRKFTSLMAAHSRIPEQCVAHLGVDIGAPALSLPDSAAQLPRPYMITVGTIEPRKNHALLLDVWESWTAGEEPAALVICGARGWNNDALFTRLDTMKAAGRPVFEFNDLLDAEMLALVQGATAALFPSFAEGYGLPQMEAATLGKPLICGDLDIYGELLGDLPVYADVFDAYSWKSAIEMTLQEDKDDGARADIPAQSLALPDWVTHFNLVLKHCG